MREPKKTDIFEILDSQITQKLNGEVVQTELEKGRIVYVSGQPADKVYLLYSGRLQLCALTDDGRKLLLGFVHPGDVFGELALVDPSPRDHSAEVRQDALIRSISSKVLIEMMRHDAELSLRIAHHIGRRLKDLNARIRSLLFKNAHARLAQSLLSLSEDCGVQDSRGILVPMPVSQEELGGMLGLSRERVNVCLKDFKQQGWVESSARKLRLVDPEKLGEVQRHGSPKIASARPRRTRWR